METATMAQQPETSQLFGKGTVADGDAAAAHSVDVEGVASQLQAVTIDGSAGEKDLAGGEGGVRGMGPSSGVSSTTTSTISGTRGGAAGGSITGVAGAAEGKAAAGDDENEILALLTQEQRAAVAFLSQLQQQHDRLEHQYENELIALKMKYEALYEPLYAQRKNCLLQKDLANPSADEKGTPAVPRFWLECLKRNSTIADLIEEHDEPILEYLQNISCEYFTPEEQRRMEREQEQQQRSTNNAGGRDTAVNSASATGGEKAGATEYPESFRLIFDFAPNPYFTPTRLVKAYHLTTVRSGEGAAGRAAGQEAEEGAAAAEGAAGAELTSTRSTEIQWEPGKDVTKKVVTRKQRNKKTRQTRVVQEVVDNESFFNFFTDHDIPTDEKLEAMTDKQVGELQMVVEADYDIGVVIRDRIIPQAVKWFLGEADDDDQMEDDIEDDDDADSDDLSESDEEDERPARGRGKVGWGGRGKGSQDW